MICGTGLGPKHKIWSGCGNVTSLLGHTGERLYFRNSKL